jgi:hypothetical protein
MSKAYTLGGGLNSTRSASSDLTPGGGPSMVDDLSGQGGKTSIPSDPTRPGGSADIDPGSTGSRTVRVGDDYKFASREAPDTSGASNVRVGDDYKFASREAPDTSDASNVRAGDDYKFAGRQAPDASGNTARVGDDWKYAGNTQAHAAPVDGSPEADAAQPGSGMAAYPAHDGLAGPSAASSVRAGDDWARRDTGIGESARIGTARLDDASAGTSRLEKLDQSFSGGNAEATAAGTDGAARLAKLDESFSGGNAAVDVPISSAGDGTAFLDDSEAYLTKIGYDSSMASSPNADATWSGDDIAGPSSIADDTVDGGSTSTDDGPNIQP